MGLTYLTNSSYTSFSTTFFSATLLSLYKSTGTVWNLSISNLSEFHFKLAKSVSLVNFDVSAPVPFFKLDFVA